MADAAHDTRPFDPDRLPGVAHPRETARLLGQEGAGRALAAAYDAGRLHHAWLLTGPRGVGKATFAYHAARFMLSRSEAEETGFGGLLGVGDASDDPLGTPDDGGTARLVRAGSHPRLFELRRGLNDAGTAARAQIVVDDVRRLSGFFQLSAADGGWRVAIVDAADDMTLEAANALLKLLEEPPARALFLLVNHAPGRLPATIRSRCRALGLRALSAEAAAAAATAADPALAAEAARALAALAGGAPGEALRLQAAGGLETYGEVLALLGSLPRLDRGLLGALARGYAGREGRARLETLARMWRIALERAARAGAGAPQEAAAPEEARLWARLAPDLRAARAWAAASAEVGARFQTALRLNLDPQRAIFDTALYLEEAAAGRA